MRSALVALSLLVGAAHAVQLTVPATVEECVYQNVEESNKLTGSYEVLAGGRMEVDALVYNPVGAKLWGAQRRGDGHFSIIAPMSGTYKVCFANVMSEQVEKIVMFSLHIGDKVFQDIAKQEHVTRLEEEIMELTDNVQQVQDEQKYMWARERRARDTNESTNSRVLWFSVAETLILVGVGVWQVLSLMSFFGTSLTR